MDEVAELLRTWELPDLIPKFSEQAINIQALSALTPEDVKDIIPQTGPRVLFMRCWRAWKAEFTSVNNISLPNLDISDLQFIQDPKNIISIVEKENVPTSNVANFMILEENVPINSAEVDQRTQSGMTVRWGIVSAGKICSDFVNAFNSYPDMGDQVIVAVAARDKGKADEFAKSHNIKKAFGSYQAMASSSAIDVVYIGALNPSHYDLTKLYLENGKHVLCEKPLCMNACQVESLMDLARKKKLFLMEGVWSRFSPAYVEMEKEIQNGKIGDVKFLEVNFGFYSKSDRVNKKEYGGSAVLDIGVYVLQLSQFIFKEWPIKVNAFGDLNEHGVDYTETIVLEYNSGKRAVLNTNTQLELRNQATVYGTKGRITLEAPFHFPDKMVTSDGKTKEFKLHTSKIPYNFQNSAGLVYEALEVAKCIKEGLMESPRMTLEESLFLAKLEDIVREQLGVQFDCDSKRYP